MRRFVIVGVLIAFLGGCTKTVYIDENGNEVAPPHVKQVTYLSGTENRFEIVEEFGDYLKEMRDVTTGVHYYFYRIASTSGVSGLTPVYESDGSVRVTNR